MQNETLTIINELGLHARAASAFVKIANKYKSNIWVRRDEMKVNGKSIMGVLMLAASKDTAIEIMAEGEDENEALKALRELVNNRFGEEK